MDRGESGKLTLTAPQILHTITIIAVGNEKGSGVLSLAHLLAI